MPSAVSSSPRSSRATPALRAAILLSALYFLARFIGLIQTAVISALLPLGASDAYWAAFTLPDYLNNLVASGALSLTFIPLFNRFWHQGKEAEAWRFFSSIISAMGLVLLVLTLAFMIWARPLILLTNSGFNTPQRAETLELAVSMTRIFLPAQLFFYAGGLMVAALNTFKRFGVTGWTGALYNFAAMAIAIPLWFLTKNPLVFAWGIFFGAFIGNFLLPLHALRRGPRAQRLRFRFRLDFAYPPLRRYIRLTLPIMFSLSIVTADVWVTKYFASNSEGAITHFNAAYRLMIAAVGLIGQAAAVAAFPFLTAQVAAGNYAGFAEFLRVGFRRLVFVTLPLSALLILGSTSITSLLYGHGQTANAQSQTEIAQSFAFLTVGLFAWATQGLISRGFYALGDTATPTRVGTFITVAIFIPLCALVNARGWGVAGLSFATSIAIAIYLAWMLLSLNARLQLPLYGTTLGLGKIAGTMVRTFVAVFLMSVAGLMAFHLARPLIGPGKSGDLILLAWTWSIALWVFVAAAARFEIPEWMWLRDKVRRRRAA